MEVLVNFILYALLWTLFTAYHILTYVLPAQVLSIYLLFGSDFFLFSWTDDMSLYFVTKWSRNGGWNCHTVTSLVLAYLLLAKWLDGAWAGFEVFMLFAYMIPAYTLEYFQWTNGVNAARRIDPTWNEHRGMLYPEKFYNRGWVEDQPYPAQDETSQIKDVSSIVTL